jgi:hypothetical protein
MLIVLFIGELTYKTNIKPSRARPQAV